MIFNYLTINITHYCYSKQLYTLDTNSKEIEYVYQTWSVNQWINNSKHTNTYDLVGNQIESISFTWNSSSNTWLNDSKSEYNNDLNGNCIEILYKTWNSQSQVWINSAKVVNYYSKLLSTDIKSTSKNISLCFPNPFKDVININCENLSLVKIRDLNGKIYSINRITERKNINVSNLPNGIYIVEISSNDGIKVCKIVKN